MKKGEPKNNIIKKTSLLVDYANVDALESKILPFREQINVYNRWLEKRLDEVLPKLMKRENIDMWIVLAKEYNEDPVLMSLLPFDMFSARRRMILVFSLQADATVESMVLSRPGIGLDDFYTGVWTNPKGQNWKAGPGNLDLAGKGGPETQLECLNRIIKERNPAKIGINISPHFAFGDGLSHSQFVAFSEEINSEFQTRFVNAERLCIGILETRLEEEVAAYTGIVQLAHALIKEAFSSRVVIPGVTTNADCKYYMLQKAFDLSLKPWFDFSVSITRKGVGEIHDETVILPGDILHCDIGINYLGLCTDTQENAYVLRMDEVDAPEDLKQAMKNTNRLQDIVVEQCVIGRSGNDVLARSRKQAQAEGLRPCIYTHPIGVHGHGAGPTIGLWDMQDGVPFQGDYPVYENTFYSLELNNITFVESWDMDVKFCAETDIAVLKSGVYYVAGRQENFHLIK